MKTREGKRKGKERREGRYDEKGRKMEWREEGKGREKDGTGVMMRRERK